MVSQVKSPKNVDTRSQQSSADTSLANTRIFNVFDNLYNTGLNCTCKLILYICTAIPFIKSVQVLEITSGGCDYVDDSLGLRISAPEGVVSTEKVLTLRFGMALHGPFEVSSGNLSSLISPILMLHSCDDTELELPITITLPIIISQATDSDLTKYNIKVVKANYDSTSSQFIFEEDNTCSIHLFSENDRSYATISLSHFCFISLLADSTLRDKAMDFDCCICPMCPSQEALSSRNFSFYLCITYYIQPCITVSYDHGAFNFI